MLQFILAEVGHNYYLGLKPIRSGERVVSIAAKDYYFSGDRLQLGIAYRKRGAAVL